MNSDDDITHMEIYKGNYYNKKRNKSSGRVIAFDLDETLGSFSDLEILWSALQCFTKEYEPINFNSILDLYPEFLRPNILNILSYLNKPKNFGHYSFLRLNNIYYHYLF